MKNFLKYIYIYLIPLPPHIILKVKVILLCLSSYGADPWRMAEQRYARQFGDPVAKQHTRSRSRGEGAQIVHPVAKQHPPEQEGVRRLWFTCESRASKSFNRSWGRSTVLLLNSPHLFTFGKSKTKKNLSLKVSEKSWEEVHAGKSNAMFWKFSNTAWEKEKTKPSN